MTQFTVCGKSFNIRLNVWLVGEIRRQTGIDLGKALTSGEVFASVLFADVEALAQLLWIVCEQQAKESEITPEQFGRSLDGDTIDSGVNSLLEAVIDFFPKARGREALKARLPRLLKDMESQVAAAIATETTISTS